MWTDINGMTMKTRTFILGLAVLTTLVAGSLASCRGGSSTGRTWLLPGVVSSFTSIGTSAPQFETNATTSTAGNGSRLCTTDESGSQAGALAARSNDELEGPVTKTPQRDPAGRCSSTVEVLGRTVRFDDNLIFEPGNSGIKDICSLTPGTIVEVQGAGDLASRIEVRNSHQFELKGLIRNLKSDATPPTFMLDNFIVDYGSMVSGIAPQEGLFVEVKFSNFDEATLTGQALSIDPEDGETENCSRSDGSEEKSLARSTGPERDGA